mmetsp:Transcript_8659/g.19301  ORF Transcript_8659/g.19301 Transcript_8659/m.19301 type:complete len:233 (-) Transcript_8659:110-808(-)
MSLCIHEVSQHAAACQMASDIARQKSSRLSHTTALLAPLHPISDGSLHKLLCSENQHLPCRQHQVQLINLGQVVLQVLLCSASPQQRPHIPLKQNGSLLPESLSTLELSKHRVTTPHTLNSCSWTAPTRTAPHTQDLLLGFEKQGVGNLAEIHLPWKHTGGTTSIKAGHPAISAAQGTYSAFRPQIWKQQREHLHICDSPVVDCFEVRRQGKQFGPEGWAHCDRIVEESHPL